VIQAQAMNAKPKDDCMMISLIGHALPENHALDEGYFFFQLDITPIEHEPTLTPAPRFIEHKEKGMRRSQSSLNLNTIVHAQHITPFKKLHTMNEVLSQHEEQALIIGAPPKGPGFEQLYLAHKAQNKI